MKNYIKTFEDLNLDDVFDAESSRYLHKLPIDIFNEITDDEYNYIEEGIADFSVAILNEKSNEERFVAMTEWIYTNAPELDQLTDLANAYIEKKYNHPNYFKNVFVQDADATEISIEFNRKAP